MASNVEESNSLEMNDYMEDLLSTSGSGNVEVNIALVGESGSGKSSFINTVLSEGSAKGNEGSQEDATTSTSKCYAHPQIKNIKLWDQPGYSNSAYPDISKYWKSLDLKKCDALLLFTRTRFTINDQRLALLIKDEGKPFYVIKTFIDEDIKTERKSKGSAFNEDETLEEIRRNIRENLKDLQSVSEQEIFLVSNIEPDKWEFSRLNKDIQFELNAASLPTKFTSRWKVKFPRNTVILMFAKLAIKEQQEIAKLNEETCLKNLKKKLAKADLTMQNYGVLAARKIMKEELNGWQESKISLAVVGDAGTGKSSFINALRGIDYDDPERAEVGVTATTVDPTKYSHPSNPNITLWDLPGMGTPKYPDLETYCKKVNIEIYDAFIIMTAGLCTGNAKNLIEKIDLSLNKPYFFVRTKIDQSYLNTMRRVHREIEKKLNEVRMLDGIETEHSLELRKIEEKKILKEVEEEEMLKKIKAKCYVDLKEINEKFDENNIFLISNHTTNRWDFPRLMSSINQRLPLSKKTCFIFSINILSMAQLEHKMKTLRGRVWMSAWLSIMRKSLTPESYSRRKDCEAIAQQVEFYRYQLGFPEKGSREFQMMSKEAGELHARIQDFYRTTENDVKFWLRKINTNAGNEGLPSWLDIDKAINEPYDFVEFTLYGVLDKMEAIASQILNEVAAREKAKIDVKIGN